MIPILILYFSILFFFLIALVILWVKDKEEKGIDKKDLPFVSVLIAVRNEEKNIIRCLESLLKINYPKDKIEILIGNDGSTDGTEELVKNFIHNTKAQFPGKDIFKLVTINTNLGNARGKANALAHLARQARGEYFCITDADIKVPANWINALLKHHDDRTGIISGVTIIEGKTLFAKLQSLEWILAFGMIKTVSDLSIPVTAVGNNMMISRKAYESVGGYETIPFSITEDFQLFRETLNKGWRYKNLLNEEVLAYSKPVESLDHLIKQRKRWMTGAFKLPLLLVVCLLVQAFFFPAILLTFFYFPVWAGLIWLFKIIFQQVFIALVMRRMNAWSGLLKYFILFELYSVVLSFLLMVYYILPVKVEWKGRKY